MEKVAQYRKKIGRKKLGQYGKTGQYDSYCPSFSILAQFVIPMMRADFWFFLNVT